MFGYIAAGRLIQTNAQQVDVNKYVFELPDAASVNHIVVFLLAPLDVGHAATVHLLWPNKEWQLLGGLSNDKASAIFRLKTVETSVFNPPVPITATLGISIEPISIVQQELMEKPSNTAIVKNGTNINQVGRTASVILENLYNYITSFTVQTLPMNAIPIGQLTENGYLPLKTFQTWYDNLSRKLATNPHYLDEEKSA
ncbi:hypothetical protein BDB01DRAFT_772641 [Pilobolus umbonatus]|nr:hypothetical protein BDB01DRAFT_772641 [Pilobolus umbonatus]